MTDSSQRDCGCSALKCAVAEPGGALSYDADLNEYQIVSVRMDSVRTTLIRFCPFCGGALPQSNRPKGRIWDPVEVERIKGLLRGLRTVEDAVRRLGPPDEDRMPTSKWMRRQLTYRSLSTVADVTLIDHGAGFGFTLREKVLAGSPGQTGSN